MAKGRTGFFSGMRDGMIEEFVKNYGLMAVFIGVALEGDATMILSGIASQLRLLPFHNIVIVGTAGAWLGDTIWYSTGRFAGNFFLRKKVLISPAEKMQSYTSTFGVWSIFASRFVYGTRILTMSFWGYHRLPFIRFALVELVGCFMWAVLLGGAGYSFSKSAEVLIGKVRNIEIWILISIILALIIVAILRFFSARKRENLF